MGGTLRDATAGWVLAAAGATAKSAAHGIGWGAVFTRVGVGLGIAASIATIIAIFPTTRNGARWAWRALLTQAGFPYRRYARNFTDRYRSYQNPYLDRHEDVDLRSTYVPLSFQVGNGQDLALASDILARLSSRRVIIIGDPGSGKSTLLKAYGVGALQGRRFLRRRHVVPYLVQLRMLARYLAADKGIADYIVDEILVRGGVFPPEQAKDFLRRTLARRQAVVLLDGLDEVPDAVQPDILAAVLAFTRDKTLERPTAKADVVVTCRTQNFRSLRDNWVPAFAGVGHQYTLAPFRNFEIMNYMRRFPDKFRTADGPARLVKAARDSKTLDLLRAPLVLAMAVGSYGYRPTELPSTITELYESMIKEMLDRNSFRREDPENSVLRFGVSDKYRFLRQFALRAVEQTGEFSDFTRPDLDEYAKSLTDKLSAVDDPAAMVTEVIQRSGLLSYVGDDNDNRALFVFAHRSIQEFLTAQELRLPGRDGNAFLLDRAGDLTWRQAILFYTAGQEADSVDRFLSDMATTDPDLAAYCLQGALPSDGAAAAVLDALKPVTAARLGALAAATRSPRQRVQQMAIGQLKAFIVDSVDALSASGAGIEAMMPLLESLAVTNAGEIAALVPQVIRNLRDDPRLVGPLWQCLCADGMELHPGECGEIVRRLLTLTMESDSFAELARQSQHDQYFLADTRWRAYPFRNGLSEDHNQVTLLAWSEYLDIAPTDPNRYFQARAAKALARTETDRQRTLSFSLCWPARFLSALEFVTALTAAAVVLTSAPGLLMNPFGWKTLLLVFGGGCLGGVIVFVLLVLLSEDAIPKSSPAKRYFGGLGPRLNSNQAFGIGTGNFMSIQLPISISRNRLKIEFTHGQRPRDHDMQLIMFILIPMAAAPALNISVAVYVLLTIGGEIGFILTNLNAFSKDVRYYVYRPNEYVDIYDDPRSRQWLGLEPMSPHAGGEGAGVPRSAEVI